MNTNEGKKWWGRQKKHPRTTFKKTTGCSTATEYTGRLWLKASNVSPLHPPDVAMRQKKIHHFWRLIYNAFLKIDQCSQSGNILECKGGGYDIEYITYQVSIGI